MVKLDTPNASFNKFTYLPWYGWSFNLCGSYIILRSMFKIRWEWQTRQFWIFRFRMNWIIIFQIESWTCSLLAWRHKKEPKNPKKVDKVEEDEIDYVPTISLLPLSAQTHIKSLLSYCFLTDIQPHMIADALSYQLKPVTVLRLRSVFTSLEVAWWMVMMGFGSGLLVLFLCIVKTACALNTSDHRGHGDYVQFLLANGVARTPPMGWHPVLTLPFTPF